MDGGEIVMIGWVGNPFEFFLHIIMSQNVNAVNNNIMLLLVPYGETALETKGK